MPRRSLPVRRGTLLALLATFSCLGAQRPAPRALLDQAIHQLGGEAFRQLHAVRLAGSASEELVGISLAGSPAVPMYREFSELRDLDRLRLRRTSSASLPMRPDPIAFGEIVDSATVAQVVGERVVAGSPSQWLDGYPWLEHGIERGLLRARDRADLTLGADTVIGGMPVRTVSFDHDRVRIYLHRDAALPVAIELLQEFRDDPTWGVWGPVRTIVVFGAWALLPNGIRYPMQSTTYRRGLVIRRTMVRQLELDPAVPADSFAIGPDLREAFKTRRVVALGAPGDSIHWVTPDLLMIPGPFNVYLARQGRDYLVIGAPHSHSYMRQVLDTAAQWFPGGRAAGVVANSATWPHLAGIGALIDRGVPIFATAPTATLIGEIARSDGQGGRPLITVIRDSLLLGRGDGALILQANGGPGATHPDQLVTWLPASGVLHAADLSRPERFEPNLWRQPLAELRDLAERHRWKPAYVVSFHVPSTPWIDAMAPLATSSTGVP